MRKNLKNRVNLELLKKYASEHKGNTTFTISTQPNCALNFEPYLHKKSANGAVNIVPFRFFAHWIRLK